MNDHGGASLNLMLDRLGHHAGKDNHTVIINSSSPLLRYHSPDAINDRANGQTQITSSTIVRDQWKMRLGIKSDSLVSRVVTCHITLATINAQVLEVI